MSRLMILTLFLIAALASSAFSAPPPPPHPECPYENPRTSWKDYITGRMPAKNQYYYFSVRFDQMKDISDRKKWDKENDPLGSVWKKSCYTVSRRGPGKWAVSGYHEKGGESRVEYFYADPNARKSAQPDQYELWIFGVVFKYDEGGRVFGPDGDHVGHLYCILDSRACDDF